VKDIFVPSLVEIGVLMGYVASKTAVACCACHRIALRRCNLNPRVHVVRCVKKPPVPMVLLLCLATVPQSNARWGISVKDIWFLLLLVVVVLFFPTVFAASKLDSIDSAGSD